MASAGPIKRPVCTGPIAWRGGALVQRDIANPHVAVQGMTPVETFMTPDLTAAWRPDFSAAAEMHVEAMNHVLNGIPEDRVRLHLCCAGGTPSPHVRDIPLECISTSPSKTRAQAISFEGANPRHAHEWQFFKRHSLADGRIIVPGVLDSTTNFVEHPELVAERLVRYADLVGRENGIAGTDCGFSSIARAQLMVHPSVTWAKLRATAEGAKLASKQLWA